MAQADSISMGFENLRVRLVGDAALCVAAAFFAGSVGGEDFQLPIRMAAGVVKVSGDWRMAQFHVSVAFGEQAEGSPSPARVIRVRRPNRGR
jgi:SnoaL-like domain